MRPLSASQLLEVWEKGTNLLASQRALLLLAATCAEFTSEQVAQFGVGQRDMLLLALREQTFGPHLASIATCPACAARLEFSVNAADIRSTPSEDLDQILEVVQT